MIQRDWLQRWKIAPERQSGDQIVQSWDTASKEGVMNDWSVCVTALVRKRRVYVLDVFRRRMMFPELLQKVGELARRYEGDALLIEDAGSGTHLIQVLRNDAPAGVPRPIARKVVVSKEVRMSAQTSRMEAGDLLLPEDAPWLAEFERELLAFPQGRHDDQADSIAQLLEWTGVRHFQPEVIIGGMLVEGEPDWL